MDNFNSKIEIDLALSDYTTSAQLHIDFYSNVKMNILLGIYATTTQLYDGFYSKGDINQMFVTSNQIVELYYTKTDTDALLANKLSNICDVSLPRMLAICTTSKFNNQM